MPARTLPRIALAVLGVLALSGCGAPPAVLRGAEETRLLVSGDANSQGVPLAGTLVILPGGCLGIDSGARTDVVAWPPGTTFAAGETVGIRLPQGWVVRVGDVVRAGGGVLGRKNPATPPKPPGCPGGEIFTASDVALTTR